MNKRPLSEPTVIHQNKKVKRELTLIYQDNIQSIPVYDFVRMFNFLRALDGLPYIDYDDPAHVGFKKGFNTEFKERLK